MANSPITDTHSLIVDKMATQYNMPDTLVNRRKISLFDGKHISMLIARFRYRSRVFDFLYEKLGSRDDAAELTRETFSKYTRIGRLLPGETRYDVILEVANGLADQFVQCAPVAEKLLEKSGNGKEVSNLVSISGQKKITARQWLDIKAILYRTARNNLTPRCREILMLQILEDRSFSEIAEMLEISESVIDKEILRAGVIFRRVLEP